MLFAHPAYDHILYLYKYPKAINNINIHNDLTWSIPTHIQLFATPSHANNLIYKNLYRSVNPIANIFKLLEYLFK